MPTTHHQLLLFFALLLPLLIVSLHAEAGFQKDPNGAAHDLLPVFGLPKGLLPGNVVSYTKSDDGQFTVELAEPCHTQFSALAFYGKTIKGKITYGVISGISGIQVKKFFIWFPITRVEAGKGDGTILFDTGHMSERHPASEFQHIRPCKKTAADA